MKRFAFGLVALAFLFTLTLAASADPFVLSSIVTNTSHTIFVAVGDLNGDGKPDLVTLDETTSFNIATNSGNGIFLSNASYGLGTIPAGTAAIADINGDGKPDVIITVYSENTVVVFTNAGGGIMVSNAAYSVGLHPQTLIAADINGDGKPDLIIGNHSDGTLTVLTNAGGNFLVSQTILVVQSNSIPYSLAVADLNADGKPDLLAGDASLDDIFEVFTNAGAGNFVSNTVYAAGARPGFLVAADFNNDGKMDIACIGLSGLVTIFTNAGNGILAKSQSFPVPGYPIPGCIAIMAVDVDGDGYTDLLVPVNGNFLKTIYNSGSNGIFITNYIGNTNVVNTSLPDNTQWVVASDINGDGKPDIVAGSDRGYYAMTNGIGTFPNSISINVYSNLNSVSVTNLTVEATGPSGAVVNFITLATNWTGSWPVSNTPPSGSTFPLGITTVTSSMAYFVKSNIFGQANTTFTVTVHDTTPPTMTLLGANPLTNYVGFYVDPGCTATDAVSGDLTGSIHVYGDVNANLAGTYTVTYSATDGAGNTGTTNRTVVLLPMPPLGAGSLAVNQTGIFWPASQTNFILQFTTNLASGNWVPVTNGIPLTGVYVPNSLPAAFFRLFPTSVP